MTNKSKIWIGGTALALPLLLWARSAGPPDPGRSGVPGEQTCNAATCHGSFPLNPDGGSVAIATAGDNYTPGTAQTITVTITGGTNYGFQATVRTAADPKGPAGTLRTTQSGTFIYCASTSLVPFSEKTSAGCPASQPLETVQHSQPNNSGTFAFEWTPPAAAVGNVIIYVAGNAANANGQPSGDRIFTATKTLTPATSGGTRPSINAGGAVSVINFGGSTTTAPGGWLEIYGANMSTTTREWAGGDFQGSNAPTSLDGVSVTIGGQPAFVRFVSPGQINAQVPNITPGPVVLSVRNAAGTSDNYTLQVADRAPGFLAPPSFKPAANQYVVAIHPDTTASSTIYYGAANLVAGLTFRPLAPGQQFTLYGISFGATDPAQAPGTIVSQSNSLPNLILRAGDRQLQTTFAGLAPSAIGLYQFNVAAPDLADGDYALTGTVGGVNLPANLFISIKRP